MEVAEARRRSGAVRLIPVALKLSSGGLLVALEPKAIRRHDAREVAPLDEVVQ
jgi:hypothetical protein